MVTKVLGTSLIIAIPALIVGRKIWWIESSIEALSLGIGISFFLFAWPTINKLPIRNSTLKFLVFISVFLSLVSWWPYANLHNLNSGNPENLAAIEFVLHITLTAATAIITYALVTMAKTGRK